MAMQYGRRAPFSLMVVVVRQRRAGCGQCHRGGQETVLRQLFHISFLMNTFTSKLRSLKSSSVAAALIARAAYTKLKRSRICGTTFHQLQSLALP
jgi:hypothetical protein